MAETIKSFVYRAYKNGASADETWRGARTLFPHKIVSWGYVRGLFRRFAEGEKIAAAFANLISENKSKS